MSNNIETNINFIMILKKFLKNNQENNHELIEFFQNNFLNEYIKNLKAVELQENDYIESANNTKINRKYEDINQQAILLFLEELYSLVRRGQLPEFNGLCLLVGSGVINYLEKNYSNNIVSLHESNPIDNTTPEDKYIITESLLYALSSLNHTETTVFRLLKKGLTNEQISTTLGMPNNEVEKGIQKIKSLFQI